MLGRIQGLGCCLLEPLHHLEGSNLTPACYWFFRAVRTVMGQCLAVHVTDVFLLAAGLKFKTLLWLRGFCLIRPQGEARLASK